MKKKILITGGAGYIGSHTLVELSKAGYDFVVYDNLSNSTDESIKRVEKIIRKKIDFCEGDIRDKKKLNDIFKKFFIDSVIHFAGLKAVGESVEDPLKYYSNNVNGTLILLEVMKENNCKKIVFSSSATVYGNPSLNPIDESFPVGEITNPYGRTKYFIEEILKDLFESDNSFKIVILRYFNPVGAHESGLIGEDPQGKPNNIMPYISQVSVGKIEYLNIFGSDYNTFDGTGVRDFIHVVDLAQGHVKAIDYINSLKEDFKPQSFNLGTGKGYSVLELVKVFEDVSNKKIPYKITQRRKGDIAECYANCTLAKNVLGWETKKDIYDMCRDSFIWQKNNPNGYK